MASPSSAFFPCPVCGEDVHFKAKSCLHCGACPKSGWNEEADVSGLDLPDDDFDYEKFKAEEFGEAPPMRGRQRFWQVTAIVLLVVLVVVTLGVLFR